MFIIVFSKKYGAGASVHVVRKLVDLQLDGNDRRTNLVSAELDVICAIRSPSRAFLRTRSRLRSLVAVKESDNM